MDPGGAEGRIQVASKLAPSDNRLAEIIVCAWRMTGGWPCWRPASASASHSSRFPRGARFSDVQPSHAAHDTFGFQSEKMPRGLSLQAQTCSSKNAADPYRFGPGAK